MRAPDGGASAGEPCGGGSQSRRRLPPPRIYSPVIATRLRFGQVTRYLVNVHGVILLVALAMCLVLAAPTAASPAVDARAGPRKPILLLIHGGGFAFGAPTWMDDAARVATARRVPARELRTRCGSAARARRRDRVAKRCASQGPLWASASGPAGPRCARRPGRRVPPSPCAGPGPGPWLGDRPAIRRDLHATQADLGRSSPALHRATRPVSPWSLSTTAWFTSRDTRRWATRDPWSAARTVAGGHGFVGTAEYAGNLRRAMRWLHRQSVQGHRREFVEGTVPTGRACNRPFRTAHTGVHPRQAQSAHCSVFGRSAPSRQ